MTIELCQPEASFLATTQAPTSEGASIRERCEDRDPDSRAFCEECRVSGRPYIDHHAASGTFRYVYFNRSKTPTTKLMARLNALGWEFSLVHGHVLKGEIYAECFGDRDSIAYQGRFWGGRGEWSPEQLQSFAERLSRLLPSFDRPGAINILVQRSIEDGYFTYKGIYPFGDQELEDVADRRYFSWCREHDHPYIIFNRDEAYVHFYHGKVLSPDAVTRMAVLADRFGMEVPDGETDGAEFYALKADHPRGVPHPDFLGFAGMLREILTDPRSYEPQPA